MEAIWSDEFNSRLDTACQAIRLAWVSDAFLAQVLYRAKARGQTLGVPVVPRVSQTGLKAPARPLAWASQWPMPDRRRTGPGTARRPHSPPTQTREERAAPHHRLRSRRARRHDRARRAHVPPAN